MEFSQKWEFIDFSFQQLVCRLFGASSINRFVHTKWSKCWIPWESLQLVWIVFFYVEHSYFDIFHFVLERKREIFAGTSITWLVCVHESHARWQTVSTQLFARKKALFIYIWKPPKDHIFHQNSGKRLNYHAILKRLFIK